MGAQCWHCRTHDEVMRVGLCRQCRHADNSCAGEHMNMRQRVHYKVLKFSATEYRAMRVQ